MTLEPLLAAPLQVQIHVACACVALGIGPFALFRRRRDRVHKTCGYIWVLAMAGLATTGVFIKSNIAVIAHFGPIHVFSVLTFWGLAEGVYAARTGQTARHQSAMQSLWYGAVCITGLLTLLPGRVINRMVFGAPSDLGYAVIALGLVGLLWVYFVRLRARPARAS